MTVATREKCPCCDFDSDGFGKNIIGKGYGSCEIRLYRATKYDFYIYSYSVGAESTGTKLSYFSYLNLPDSHKGWKNMNKVTTLIIPVSRLIYIKEVDTTVDQDGNEVSQ